MTSRDTVLGSIRRSLGVKGSEAARRAAVGARLAGAPAGVIPARGQVDAEGRIALFTKYAEKTAATVARVAETDAVPLAVADFLRSHNLPPTVRMGDDGLVAGLPWEKTQIEVSRGVPAVDLAHRAEKMNLLVVGAHHGGVAGALLFGSVSTGALEHATCPVAVVPV